MQRRGFLGAMLAAASAPAFVKAESLMGLYVPKAYATGGIALGGTYVLGSGRLWLEEGPYPFEKGGELIALAQPRTRNYAQFEAEMIRKIAVGLSIPFTELTKDFPLINEPAKR